MNNALCLLQAFAVCLFEVGLSLAVGLFTEPQTSTRKALGIGLDCRSVEGQVQWLSAGLVVWS